MKTTTNYGLKKPDGTDLVNIEDLNGNMDTIDTQLKTAANHATDSVKHISSTERSNWNAKASTAVATTSANGLMAATDKSKLNGIATGANNYTHPASHPMSMIERLPETINEINGQLSSVGKKTVTFVVGLKGVHSAGEVDYLADNAAGADVAINAAIQALPAGGGKIVILEGTYYLNATLNVTKPTLLCGCGSGTIVKSNWVRGDLYGPFINTFLMDTLAFECEYIHFVLSDSENAQARWMHFIDGDAKRLSFSNCVFENMGDSFCESSVMAITNYHKLSITNCDFISSLPGRISACMYINAWYHAQISNCTFYDVRFQFNAIAFLTITNNHLDYSVLNSYNTTYAVKLSEITNVTFMGNTIICDYGLNAFKTSGVISNNSVKAPVYDVDYAGSIYGFNLTGITDSLIVSNNTVFSDWTDTALIVGTINVANTAKNIFVTNNIVHKKDINPGIGATNTIVNNKFIP